MIISIFKGFCCFTWLEDLEVQGVLLFPLIPDTFGQSRALHARDEACATVFERWSHLGPPESDESLWWWWWWWYPMIPDRYNRRYRQFAQIVSSTASSAHDSSSLFFAKFLNLNFCQWAVLRPHEFSCPRGQTRLEFWKRLFIHPWSICDWKFFKYSLWKSIISKF